MLNQLCHAVHYKTKNSPLRRCCRNMYSCPDVLPFSTLQDYPLKPTRQSRLERRQLEDKKCLLAIEAMCPQLQSSECSWIPHFAIPTPPHTHPINPLSPLSHPNGSFVVGLGDSSIFSTLTSIVTIRTRDTHSRVVAAGSSGVPSWHQMHMGAILR